MVSYCVCELLSSSCIPYSNIVCSKRLTLNLIDHRTGTVQDTREKQPTTASPTTERPTKAPVGMTKRPTSIIIPKETTTASSSSVNVTEADDSASAQVNEYIRIRDVIVSASPYSKMAIADQNSTQSRALGWLFSSDPRELSDLRLVQRWALASFYYATNGNGWVDKLGWMEPRDECEWYGVTCIDGVICKLELIQNRLVGELVPEISTWTNLYWLSLGNDYDAPEEEKNEIIMPLPSFLGDLNNLAFLNLANVGLTSTIPQELFTSWSRLKSLFLNDNDITGTLPNSIEHLDSIEVLWLGGNNLGGSILSEIGRLVSLRDLSLDSNFREDATGRRGFIATIPSEIGQLTSLEILSLADNAMSGLVPMHLGGLVSLRRLQLSGNFFESQLPPTLGRLEMLEELDISFNWYVLFAVWRFCFIIVILRKKLFLGIPRLSSTIPPEWGNMISLNRLSLASNYNDDDGYFTGGIIGTLPPELANLKNLKEMDLSNNYLTGTLITEIGQLHLLQSLYIQNNFLTGSIPQEFVNCVSLRELVLQDNDLKSTIGMPEEICRLPELNMARVDCDLFCSCCQSLC